eukprot:2613083-Rhodomonas_salina.1
MACSELWTGTGKHVGDTAHIGGAGGVLLWRAGSGYSAKDCRTSNTAGLESPGIQSSKIEKYSLERTTDPGWRRAHRSRML